MLKNYELSKNPLDFVYAAIWLIAFTAFAIYIASGDMFKVQPKRENPHCSNSNWLDRAIYRIDWNCSNLFSSRRL